MSLAQKEKEPSGKQLASGTVIDMETFNEMVESGEISKKDVEHVSQGLDINGFREAVAASAIKNVVLLGNEDKFNIFADIRVRDNSGKEEYKKHSLLTKLHRLRNITNPQTAFKLISELGIKKYRVIIKNWNSEGFFNKHKLSVDSRERAQLKKSAVEHRYVFLEKFIKSSAKEFQSYPERAKYLTERAIGSGYVNQRKPVTGNHLTNWVSDRNPPAWAVKAALDVCVEKGIYPNKDDSLEMAAFANIWFSTRGPFMELEKAMESLPEEKGFPRQEMEVYMKTEVNHYKYIKTAKPKIDQAQKSN